MSANTTVIDIVAQVSDQTADGVRSSTNNLTKLEAAVKKMQTSLSQMQGQSRIEVAATLKDSVSKGISSIISYGKNIAGKTWSVTLKALDYATAPIQGLINLLKNPITQMVAISGVSMGVGDTISTYADYEQSLANTRAVTGASDEEMEAIATMVKGYGATTAFSASQVGTAATVLGTAGWTSDSIVDGMGGILSLASAGDVSMETSADITTSTIAQWGMDASASDHVADVLAATASSSKTDVDGLGETFKYAGSMASALEYSLEDTAIAVGLMGNAAIDGSQAGTSLRTIFSNLIDPTTDTAASMEKLGISLTDQNGEMKSLMEVMEDLRGGFDGLTAEEQAFYASSIAGTEGLSGLLAIVNASEEDFYALTDSVYGASGAASEMAAIRMDSLQGDFLSLQSAAEGVKIEIGERLQPMLRSFVQWATNKMPDVTKAFNSAFDWADTKFQDVSFKVTAMMETEEWEEADLFQKIQLTFDTLVGDPFKEWWANSGLSLSVEYAGKIGETVSSVLSGGIITLLGLDIGDAASDGMQIGAAFVEGFKEGFDTESIAEGLKNALSAVAKDAGTLVPGGEEASSTSLLSAGVLGYGALKVGGAVGTSVKNANALYEGGKTLYQNASTIASAVFPRTADFATGLKYTVQANDSAASSAVRSVAGFAQSGQFGTAGKIGASVGNLVNKGSAFLSSPVGKTVAGVGGKALGALGIGLEAASGVSRAEEWTGSDNTWNKVASGLGSVLGGTGDGILGEKSVFGKILDVGAGALKGAGAGAAVGTAIGPIGTAAGAIGGAVAGGVSAMVGGENWAKLFSSEKLQEGVYNYFENLHNAWTTFWDSVHNFFTSTVPTAISTIGSAVETFFTEKVPKFFSDLTEGATAFFTQTVPFALGYIAGSIYAFFTETVPDFFTGLWEGGVEIFTVTIPECIASVGEGITTFFTETVPEFFSGFWEGGVEIFTVTIPECIASVGEGITTFFTETVPDFFTELWEGGVEIFTVTIPECIASVGEGITTFFTETVPDFFKDLWDGATESFLDPIAQATVSISESISGFFSSATEKVTNFFSSAWDSATTFFSGGFSAGSTTAHAEGGILSTPHIGLVAEDGPEAIIPLSGKRRSRGIELWEKAGQMLGVTPKAYANGGIVGADKYDSGDEYDEDEDEDDNRTETPPPPPTGDSTIATQHGGTAITVPVSIGNITFEVNVKTEGNNADNLVAIIKENVAEMTDEIAYRLATSLKQVFANMTLATEV